MLTVAAMICAQGPAGREQDLAARAPDRLRPQNLGASLAHGAVGRGTSIKEATLRRLILIGRQHPAGAHRLLPRTVMHLRELGVPVDWVRLIVDLSAWRRHRRDIARRWIQDYHRTLHRLETEKARNESTDAESESK